jgi:hypothetical protein
MCSGCIRLMFFASFSRRCISFARRVILGVSSAGSKAAQMIVLFGLGRMSRWLWGEVLSKIERPDIHYFTAYEVLHGMSRELYFLDNTGVIITGSSVWG